MAETQLLTRIFRGISRERGAGLRTLLSKGVRLISESAAARIHLRGCDRVGPGARAMGRPRIENRGRIEIGGGFSICSWFSPVDIVAGPGGAIEIGESVWLNFGTAIHARQRVQIGDRTHVGQYSILSDTEVPEVDGAASEEPRPIRVGADVWIAGRVTVLPGASIGDGSVITTGSIVSGEIPPGVVAGGIPARVLRRINGELPLTADEPAPLPSAARAARPAAPGSEMPGPPVAAPNAEPGLRGVLLADFTIAELARHLAKADDPPAIAADVAPFGQVVQSMIQGPSADFAVVWTRPEGALQGFRRVLEIESVAQAELLAEVDAFCAMLERGATRFKFVFVPTWTVPSWQRGLGAVDGREAGVSRALMAANLRLCENLARAPNVHTLNAQRWIDAAGRGYAPKAWYLGKVAFHDEVLAEAARDIKAALRALTGQARKLLVLDLDDTLWGGIVGEVGWENLRLGGHDSEGEAFADFQRAAKALTRRGVVLGIVSKNEEAVALEAIRKHPEMVLRESDFVGWRINWADKARNVADLAAELNLGLQSVVFIDDSPVERARVREALPEVLVPEWPSDKLLYPSALLGLRCFDAPTITAEDAQRTRLYSSEHQRNALLQQVSSVEEWLKGLEIRVRVEPLGAANLARTAQLLNKTNQMNLSTRRMGEAELLAWARAEGHSLWTVTVSDRFGDAGLTGIVGFAAQGGVARIVDFVLSCRVMGRKVEETMLHVAIAEAARLGLTSVEARYLPTAKNKPCLSFFQGSGFRRDGERFVWDAAQPFVLPEAIALERVS